MVVGGVWDDGVVVGVDCIGVLCDCFEFCWCDYLCVGECVVGG